MFFLIFFHIFGGDNRGGYTSDVDEIDKKSLKKVKLTVNVV